MAAKIFRWNLLYQIIFIVNFVGRRLNSSAVQPEIAILQLEFSYSNPDHVSASGKCDNTFGDIWCDVFFKICITTENAQNDCDLLDMETSVNKDQAFIEYKKKNAIQVKIFEPIPKYINIMIAAIDYDLITTHDHIASFVSRNLRVPISNRTSDAKLRIIDPNSNNQGVKIKGSLTLICNTGYYGDYCAVHCLPNLSPRTLDCHSNGSFICNKGFRGENCEKPDPCFYNPCIADATCINTDSGKGYRCYCGGSEDQHCYANYNPCVPSPCQNDGRCVRSGENHEKFLCKCSFRWTGKLCTLPLSPCEVARHKLATADLADLFDGGVNLNYSSSSSASATSAVCYHDGICVDNLDDFKFSCNCTIGWGGERCDEPDRRIAIISGSVCVGIIFIVCLAVIPCIIRVVEKRKVFLEEFKESGFIYKKDYPTYFGNIFNTPYQTVGYSRQIIPPGVALDSIDNSYEYDYCNPLYTTPKNELITFSNNEKINPTSGPPLPDRPTKLTPAFQENVSLRLPVSMSDRANAISTSSEHPLLYFSMLSPNEETHEALPYRST